MKTWKVSSKTNSGKNDQATFVFRAQWEIWCIAFFAGEGGLEIFPLRVKKSRVSKLAKPSRLEFLFAFSWHYETKSFHALLLSKKNCDECHAHTMRARGSPRTWEPELVTNGTAWHRGKERVQLVEAKRVFSLFFTAWIGTIPGITPLTWKLEKKKPVQMTIF